VEDAFDAIEGGEDFGAEEAVGVGEDADAHGVRIAGLAGLAESGRNSEPASQRVGFRSAEFASWRLIPWPEQAAERGFSAGESGAGAEARRHFVQHLRHE
jgi:hypothetical protein